jgi:hypothetical protein
MASFLFCSIFGDGCERMRWCLALQGQCKRTAHIATSTKRASFALSHNNLAKGGLIPFLRDGEEAKIFRSLLIWTHLDPGHHELYHGSAQCVQLVWAVESILPDCAVGLK